MITAEQAIKIAKAYAEKRGRGWDECSLKTTPVSLAGEPVWRILTADVKYSEAFPWMMEYFPSPSYYYVSMVEGKCIAVGTRENDIQPILRK